MNLSSATTEKLQRELQLCKTIMGVIIAMATLVLLILIYLKAKPFTFGTVFPVLMASIAVVARQNAIKAELKTRGITDTK